MRLAVPRINFGRRKIGVVYSHEYNLSLTANDAANTFDPLKFKKIRDLLVAKNLLNRKKILLPHYVKYSEIELVHSKNYIKQIQNPVIAGEMLNIEAVDPWDPFILEYFRIMTGGTLLATKFALEHNSVAFNLGGGFHHAHAEKAAGYCLINDVAIAIEKFRNRRAFRRPMIVDLDYHEGDGNLIFYQHDADVYTFSMHACDWVNIEKENNTDIMLPAHCDGEMYLKILREQLPLACHRFKPDIIFYIAGSDPYEKDVIADLNLSQTELLERNIFVYEKVRSRGIPMVVVAGGGYGSESWQIYYDFLEYALVNR